MGIRRLLIGWNNRLARWRLRRVGPEALLLLAPHCLQKSACKRVIMPDAGNCARCGACNIAGLLELRDAFGLRCLVAGGGRQALGMVKDRKVRGVMM